MTSAEKHGTSFLEGYSPVALGLTLDPEHTQLALLLKIKESTVRLAAIKITMVEPYWLLLCKNLVQPSTGSQALSHTLGTSNLQLKYPRAVKTFTLILVSHFKTKPWLSLEMVEVELQDLKLLTNRVRNFMHT